MNNDQAKMATNNAENTETNKKENTMKIKFTVGTSDRTQVYTETSEVTNINEATQRVYRAMDWINTMIRTEGSNEGIGWWELEPQELSEAIDDDRAPGIVDPQAIIQLGVTTH